MRVGQVEFVFGEVLLALLGGENCEECFFKLRRLDGGAARDGVQKPVDAHHGWAADGEVEVAAAGSGEVAEEFVEVEPELFSGFAADGWEVGGGWLDGSEVFAGFGVDGVGAVFGGFLGAGCAAGGAGGGGGCAVAAGGDAGSFLGNLCGGCCLRGLVRLTGLRGGCCLSWPSRLRGGCCLRTPGLRGLRGLRGRSWRARAVIRRHGAPPPRWYHR
jgi:hypothetical protein